MGAHTHFRAYPTRLGQAVVALLWCASGQAAEWSNAELQRQIGNLVLKNYSRYGYGSCITWAEAVTGG